MLVHHGIFRQLSLDYEPITLQAVSSKVSSVIPSSVNRGGIGSEPDDAWKDTLKKRIEELKSEEQKIMDRIMETQKESSSPVTTKSLDELLLVESRNVDEDQPALRNAITGGTVGSPTTETIQSGADPEAEIVEQGASLRPADQAWTLDSTVPEKEKLGPPSRSESQSTVTDWQHDKSSLYSSPSSPSGGQRSGVRPLPSLPNASNCKASILSLQEWGQATQPSPGWPISKVSFNDDHDYPATAYQPERVLRVTPWQDAIHPPISPSRRWPSESGPAFNSVQETFSVNYPSYAMPEGLSILF